MTGAAGAALVLALAWNPAWHVGFSLIALVILLLALDEYFALASKLGWEAHRVPGLAVGGLMLWQGLGVWRLGLPSLPWAPTLGTLLLLGLSVLRGGAQLQFKPLAATFLGLAYVAGLGSSLGGFLSVPIEHGLWTWGSEAALPNNLVPLLGLTWLFDSASMFSGLRFGRSKLSPASPNKTWEGFAGGLIAASTLALLLPFLGFWKDLGWLARLGGVLVLAPAAALGDLVESSLKREAGVKDSASLSFLPGHGGFLDKVDALLFAAPVLMQYLILIR